MSMMLVTRNELMMFFTKAKTDYENYVNTILHNIKMKTGITCAPGSDIMSFIEFVHQVISSYSFKGNCNMYTEKIFLLDDCNAYIANLCLLKNKYDGFAKQIELYDKAIAKSNMPIVSYVSPYETPPFSGQQISLHDGPVCVNLPRESLPFTRNTRNPSTPTSGVGRSVSGGDWYAHKLTGVEVQFLNGPPDGMWEKFHTNPASRNTRTREHYHGSSSLF